MNLTEYIDKTKVELGMTYDTKDIEKYVIDMARKELKSKNGCVEDSKVHSWIVEYKPKDEDEKAKEAEKKKAEEEIKSMKQIEEEKTGQVALF